MNSYDEKMYVRRPPPMMQVVTNSRESENNHKTKPEQSSPKTVNQHVEGNLHGEWRWHQCTPFFSVKTLHSLGFAPCICHSKAKFTSLQPISCPAGETARPVRFPRKELLGRKLNYAMISIQIKAIKINFTKRSPGTWRAWEWKTELQTKNNEPRLPEIIQ